MQSRIREGVWKPGDRIPNPDDLAAEFAVGHSTVREALLFLEQGGLITRIHGVGSFVNQNPTEVLASLEHLEAFTESIRSAGHDAEDIVLSISSVEADRETAQGLGLTPGSPVVRIESLRRADGRPVMHCVDCFSQALIGDLEAFAQLRSTQPLMQICAEHLHRPIGHALLTLSVALADKAMATHLEVNPGFPLLVLRGPAYDLRNRPVYSPTYHIRTDIYKFTVIRH